MLETVRDADSTRALPNLVQALLDLLRSGEPSFHKDSSEYQFRRVLFETLNRLPLNDALKSKIPPIWAGMLHVLRHENEENGITASKMLMDIVRGHRSSVTEENMVEFVTIFQEAFASMQGLVNQYFSEDSLPVDANISLPALQSFKVLAEMTMVMVLISQLHKNIVSTTFQGTTALAFEVLALESPAQHRARTEHEAMGGFWAGMSPTIRNAGLYSDFIYAQIKAGGLQCLSLEYLISGDLDAAISHLRHPPIR
jgi:transformation/transcription domain-associated protein